MKKFLKKFKTNFSFRKKTIVIGSLCVVGILAIVFLTLGSNMSASVITSGITDKCTDSDGGVDFFVKGTAQGRSAENNQWTTKTDFCSMHIVNEYSCDAKGKKVIAMQNACADGCANGACIIAGGGYGYGYGYRSTGGNNGYGYGYGYKKIDPNTHQPYIYLLDVFEKYSKKVYTNVIEKIGFVMVKFFNVKEFKASTKK